jgi:ribosomal protein L4
MEAKLYNKSGKEMGKVVLPESVFSVAWNRDLVHQVVTAMAANARTPVAHTKDRSEVSGTWAM